MSNKRQETIADLVAWLRRPREGENAYLTLWRAEIADRIEAAEKHSVTECNRLVNAAHKREMADEKRISDAVIQSLRDKKLEMAGEIAKKDEEISGLRALVKAAGESETISQPDRGARRNAETTEAKDPTHSAVRKG